MTTTSPTSIINPEVFYTALFDAMPGNSVLVKNDPPRFSILAATPQYLKDTGTNKSRIVGRGMFEAFPSVGEYGDESTGSLNASFKHVLKYKEAHHLPVQRYDLKGENGETEEKYWKAFNSPVFNNDSEVVFIVHTAEDITPEVKAKQREERNVSIEKTYDFFMNAPVIIGLLKGDDYVIELANEGLLEVWGKDSQVVGKPLLKAMPELTEQGFIPLLDNVRKTGEPFYAYNYPIRLNRNGIEEVFYFDFVYKPFYDFDSGEVASGVLSVGHEVTSQVLAMQKVQESEAKYRTLFNTMDQGFCVLEIIFDSNNKAIDYLFVETNPVFEKQTGLKDAVNKTALELVPNLEPYWIERYGTVAQTGEAIHFTDISVAMGRWFEVYAFMIGEKGSNRIALLFTDISERKKAEDALRQSENNLRNTILQAPVAMSIFRGSDYIVEVANDRMIELLGRGREEVMNKPIFEAVPEVKNQGYEDLLYDVYTTGKTFAANGIPVTLPRNESVETIYIDLLYQPFKEADGSISGILAVAIDVTNQVTYRMKVEESNQELKFVTDFMPQIIWATKPDGYHEFYNKQWYDYTGLTYEQSKDTGWNTVVHPDDQERAWEVWRYSLKTGHPYEIEYRFRRHDGEYRWFLGRALPLRDEAGNILKWYGTCTDMHDQKKASDLLEEKVKERTHELENQKNLLDNILTNSSNGISVSEMIRNADGKIVDARTILANDSAIKYVGLPREVYLSKTANDLAPGILESHYGQMCLDTLATGQPSITQYYMEISSRWLELTISKMDDNHLIHIFTDVTPIKESHLQLEKTVMELKRSNTNLEDFAYAASHDLKEPIRKIRTFSDRLKSSLQEKLSEQDLNYFNRMEKSTERMQFLIDDLLEYSHVSTAAELVEDVDLNKKVAQVLEDLEVEVAERKADITVGALPVIKGHRRQLQQLLQNLITNALKFSKQGVNPEISINSSVIKGEDLNGAELNGAAENETYNVINISDNGIGFEQEYAEKIFKMFQRLHGKAEYEGTGIGLAIVRKVVENHKGFIKAESEVGKGSTFKVFLPIQ